MNERTATTHQVVFGSSADLSTLENGSVDLVVTSPPYPMIEMWDETFGQLNRDIADALAAEDGTAAYRLMHNALDSIWKECFRILKPGGFMCINVGDATRTVADVFRLYTNHSRITAACEQLGFHSLPPVIWRKPANGPTKFMGSGMLPSGAYLTLEHEYVLVFRKGHKRSFSPQERERRQRSAFFWEERNQWFSDLWDLRGVRQGLSDRRSRNRSGAYPFELPFRLIHMYSMEGDLVLDPFLGTGTTTAAAMAGARNSVGVELTRELAETIEETLVDAAETMNRRQMERLKSHQEFMNEYQTRPGRTSEYVNEFYGFPVVTRQEMNLTLPATREIEREKEGRYTARHEPLGLSDTLSTGLVNMGSGARQMDLGL